MLRPACTLFGVMLPCGSAAGGFDTFQASSNDCTSSVDLHLCVRLDGTASSDPDQRCSGVGGGEEYCGWDVRIEATDEVRLEGFSNDGKDVVSNETTAVFSTGGVFRANGGEPIFGQKGANPFGTLTVSSGPGGGTIEVTGNLYVTAALETAPVTASTLAQPCSEDPDGDGDGAQPQDLALVCVRQGPYSQVARAVAGPLGPPAASSISEGSLPGRGH